MNSRGQASTTFRFFIYAIVVLAVIALIYTFFIVKPGDPVEEMGKAIAYSQSNLGKSYTKEVFFPLDFSVSAERSLDDSMRNVSFHCFDTTVCGKVLDVTPKRVTSLKEGVVKITSRCNYAYTVFECKIYFGLPPAQSSIGEAEIPAVVDAAAQEPKIEIKITNIGSQTAANVFLTVELYKKELVDNEDRELLYSEMPVTEFVETLAPNEERSFSVPLKINRNGEFVVRYRVEGLESGYEEGKAEFKVVNAPEEQICFVSNIGETYLSIDRGLCETQFFCSGCETAAECAYKWQLTEPEGGFEPVTTDYTIITYEPYENGKCTIEGGIDSGNQPVDGGQGTAGSKQQLVINNEPLIKPVQEQLQKIIPSKDTLLNKAEQYDEIIQQHSNGIDPNIVKGMIAAESSFVPTKISNDNQHYGLMQVSKDILGDSFDKWQDPAVNIDKGTEYLKDKVIPTIEKYDCGDEPIAGIGVSKEMALSIGAYNSGPNRDSYKNCEVPPIDETENHIPKVIANYSIFAGTEQEVLKQPIPEIQQPENPDTSEPPEPSTPDTGQPDEPTPDATPPDTQEPETPAPTEPIPQEPVPTTPQTPPILAAGWIWPVKLMQVNSCYGYRPYLGKDFHGGVDMPVPQNTPVMAVDDGVVYIAKAEKCKTGFGNCVVVKHSANLFSSYNHLEKIIAKEGGVVKKGDLIGLSGNSGGNYGYHLHIAVFTNQADVQIGVKGKNPICSFPESLISQLKFTGTNCKPPYPDPKTNGC